MYECEGQCARRGVLVCKRCFGNQGQGHPCRRCRKNACCNRCEGYESVRLWCTGSNGTCIGYERGLCHECCVGAPCCDALFCVDCIAQFQECATCGDVRCPECLRVCCSPVAVAQREERRQRLEAAWRAERRRERFGHLVALLGCALLLAHRELLAELGTEVLRNVWWWWW